MPILRMTLWDGVFVTVDPYQAFTADEVDAIIGFVADGGGLWVIRIRYAFVV